LDLNNAVYPTAGVIAGGVAGNQLSKQDALPEYMRPYAEQFGMLLGGSAGSLLKYASIPNSYISDILRYPIIAPYEMARGNYVFGSKAKAMLKRTQQESKYFNTVYDDLVDKYINKNVYPGFGDIKPKFKMEVAPTGDYGAFHDPRSNTVVTPMFNSKNTRIAIPFDIYRKGTISHEATHALHKRANEYDMYGPGVDIGEGIVYSDMKPLSTPGLTYNEMNPDLRNIPVYRTHYNNVKNANVDPDFKTWMSSPEEWHSEYNNIISRVANGSVVPVSDLTRNQRDVAINYFVERFGVNVKQAEQALDMIDDYQRNFLQGARVNANIALRLRNNITPTITTR
jgi:hypothetical protein